MMPARTRLLLLGLAAWAVWAALWALLGCDFWYVGATCLFFALLVAWRIDVTTREILRRRAEDEKNLPRRGDDSSQT
jgi:membrane protein implicated in regulation of membrane protease activity